MNFRPQHHDRPPPQARHQGRSTRTDAGSATVEVAILMPLVMLLLMLVVQAGLYFHTRAVAVTAARKAVAVASSDGGTTEAGQSAAARFLDQNGAALAHRHVDVTNDGTTAKVRVSGDVASVVFGVPFGVTVVVDAPVERVTP